jgi:hypothetical protein
VGRLASRFLLEGVRIRQFSRTVTGTREASREVGGSAECYEHSSSAPVGLTRSRFDLAVSDVPAVFLEIPAPALLRQRVHPLVSFTSSSEYVAARHPPDRSEDVPGTSSKVLLLFATSTLRVH